MLFGEVCDRRLEHFDSTRLRPHTSVSVCVCVYLCSMHSFVCVWCIECVILTRAAALKKPNSNERKTVKAAKRRIWWRSMLPYCECASRWLLRLLLLLLFFSSHAFKLLFLHSHAHHPATRMALRCHCQSNQSLRSYFDCTRSGTLEYRPWTNTLRII